jgi:predicted  nucleic acid-binding Zn-ribbon protein
MKTDNSRHQSITGNVTNANVNFGDNSTLTNTITQLPSENAELKDALSQLQALINSSSLSDSDKKEALAETKTIAEAAGKPKDEQESVVRKTLRYFKGLRDDLENVPEIAAKLGETVAKIALLFGI